MNKTTVKQHFVTGVKAPQTRLRNSSYRSFILPHGHCRTSLPTKMWSFINSHQKTCLFDTHPHIMGTSWAQSWTSPILTDSCLHICGHRNQFLYISLFWAGILQHKLLLCSGKVQNKLVTVVFQGVGIWSIKLNWHHWCSFYKFFFLKNSWLYNEVGGSLTFFCKF